MSLANDFLDAARAGREKRARELWAAFLATNPDLHSDDHAFFPGSLALMGTPTALGLIPTIVADGCPIDAPNVDPAVFSVLHWVLDPIAALDVLLAAGAPIDRRDNFGRLPIDVVAERCADIRHYKRLGWRAGSFSKVTGFEPDVERALVERLETQAGGELGDDIARGVYSWRLHKALLGGFVPSEDDALMALKPEKPKAILFGALVNALADEPSSELIERAVGACAHPWVVEYLCDRGANFSDLMATVIKTRIENVPHHCTSDRSFSVNSGLLFLVPQGGQHYDARSSESPVKVMREAAKALIARGADPNLTNADGKTAADLAKAAKFTALHRWLKKRMN